MIAEAEVLRSRALTPTTHGIRVARPPGFDYAPVQFVGLELETEEGSLEYPMSLASSPTRPHLEFGARLSGSAWKRAFAALRPGDVVELDGPYGHFVLDERRPAVFVAGGIGITPLKGMMEYAADKALPVPVVLLYSNATEEEVAYRAELEDLARANPRASLVLTLTQGAPAGWKGREGRVDEGMLREAAQGLGEPVWYVCGKPGMVADVVRMLQGLGVPRRDVRFEQFYGY